MVNELPETLLTGTFGELLVQMRLLQCGVQAVPPHKDTGNDLLATKLRVLHPMQVKTSGSEPFKFDRAKIMDRDWDILALVLIGEAEADAWDKIYVALDTCRVFLLERDQVTKGYFTLEEIEAFEWSYERVSALFDEE
jgi:hypothetical protein